MSIPTIEKMTEIGERMRNSFLPLVKSKRDALRTDITLYKFRDFLHEIYQQINGLLNSFDDQVILSQDHLRKDTFSTLQSYLISWREKAKTLVNSQSGNDPT